MDHLFIYSTILSLPTYLLEMIISVIVWHDDNIMNYDIVIPLNLSKLKICVIFNTYCSGSVQYTYI